MGDFSGGKKTQESLFARTFTKEEVLGRERFFKIENSEVPADRVNIKKAVDKAIAKMDEQFNAYSQPQKE
jgi:hypothetical protein